MNTEAHLVLGYFLAHAASGHDRRFRALITLAALLPDIDTAAYIFGQTAYSNDHHAIGHNVFFFTLASLLMLPLYPRAPWKLLLFTQLALYSHYAGDYFLTRFPLYFFWPIPHKPFLFSHKIGLDHPINNTLSYLSFASFILTAWLWNRTPIELFSPNLDQRIINLFRRKPLRCHLCGKPANERCHHCHEPLCLRHGRIGKHFLVSCPAHNQPLTTATPVAMATPAADNPHSRRDP